MASSDVNELPDEILLNVMRWLPTAALVRMMLVSKNAHRLAGDAALWKEKIFREFNIDLQHVCDANMKLSWPQLYGEIKNRKVHPYVCSECQEFPISSAMFKCFHCANYVLCSVCFDKSQNSTKGSGVHEEGHLFVKMSSPASAQQTLLYFLFPKAKNRVHKGYGCAECGVSPIVGSRYKCRQCPSDFSLCEACHLKLKTTAARSPGVKRHKICATHNSSHDYLQILFHEKRHSSHDTPTWCDACTQPIRGTRFKCLNCFNYDLCAKCEGAKRHKNKEFHHSYLVLDGVSLCCYNLQYIDWMERTDYNNELMKLQQMNISCNNAPVMAQRPIS